MLHAVAETVGAIGGGAMLDGGCGATWGLAP
jgi:hypothetical protein